jgi:hypothetical protein
VDSGSEGSITSASSILDKYQNSLKALYIPIKVIKKLDSSSVSKKQLVLEIKGRSKISCALKRHLSPLTVGKIMRSLPLEGHAHMLGKNIAYFETMVDSGIERPKTEFKKGDVAFMSSTGSICFFIEDSKPGKPMTPIGKLDDIEELKNLKPGDVFFLYEETG